MTLEKKIQEKELKIEIAQSKRENDFIIKNYEKSKKYLNKKREEENKDKDDMNNNNNNKENKKIKNKNKNKENNKYKQKKLVE
jgi:hypothetical protein